MNVSTVGDLDSNKNPTFSAKYSTPVALMFHQRLLGISSMILLTVAGLRAFKTFTPNLEKVAGDAQSPHA